MCIYCKKESNIIRFECLSGEPITRGVGALGDSTWIEGCGGGNVNIQVNLEQLRKYG